MANRKRNARLRFNLTDEEKELFERKMKESGAKNMSHFIRKTVLEKEIYHVDLSPLLEIKEDLKKATDYINQVAKQTNLTGILYNSDVEKMKALINDPLRKVEEIRNALLLRGGCS
jgi:hypothetical protein